ncbi:MAG: sigma-70 family RNA polymerase sigma factor, partial [Elusimicrobiales bacterium]|nr:sigma-70 family RNA polymerase sigma factor [Elusimicrobiales bacterium]
EARDLMVRANLRLVVNTARGYMNKGLSLPDLIEEGNLGLYHAVEKYDPGLGYRFSTYASYWIEQHIRRYVEESSKTIRIPPHAWTAMRKWQREYKDFQEKFGRKPEISEISRILGWTESQVRSAMNTADIVTGMSSIDAPRSLGEDEGNTLEDVLHGGPEDTPEHLMTETNKMEVLKDALGELDPREREILEARYGLLGDDPKTLNEIGQSLNLSRERVRQLEARALQTLRRAAISLGLIDDGIRSRGSSKKKNHHGSRLEVLTLALKGNNKNKSSDLRILKIPRRKK